MIHNTWVPITVRDLIKMIEKKGWVQVDGGKGSHRKFHHPTNTETIIVSGQLYDTVKPGAEHDIKKQAGLK